MRRTVVLGIAGAAVITATATGVAFAADGSSPTSGSSTGTSATAVTAAATSAPTAPNAKSRRHHRAAAARALHGSFTVERKGVPAVVDVQRGTVTAVAPNSITVRSRDGFSATYGLTSATKIRKDKKPTTASDVPVGTTVGVLADDAGGHPTARTVRVVPKR